MPSLYSTKTQRRRLTKIPVEFCPGLSISDLANQGFLNRVNAIFFGYMQVKDRIDLGVHAYLQFDNPHLEIQYQLAKGAAGGWLTIEMSPRSSRRVRYPFRFICPGRRLEDGTFSGCGKRVDVLYIPDFGGLDFLACRRCHGLTYLSRQVSREAKPIKRPLPRLTPGLPPFIPPGTGHSPIEGPDTHAN